MPPPLEVGGRSLAARSRLASRSVGRLPTRGETLHWQQPDAWAPDTRVIDNTERHSTAEANRILKTLPALT